MKQQSSATTSSPPRNSGDDYASEYVIVRGLQTTMPPSRSKPPPRRAGYFPVTFTVRLVHPNPNRKSSHYDVVRYKTSYEFWVNCDDFSCPERGVAAVNRLVDLMNVPFPLQNDDVQLFWKANLGVPEVPVVNWNRMVVLLALLLRDVNNLVRKQEEENSEERYPYVKLEISKFVKVSKEELEAAARAAAANGGGTYWALRRPQREMERRMAVVQSEAVERVKLLEGGAEECGICLMDMCVGSEVARLPCSHYTHERCILSWFMTSNSCPFCRFNIAAIEGKTRPTQDHYWSTPYQHNSTSTPAAT